MAYVVNAYSQYKKHDVMMANPLELIVMLYNGCIKQLKLAKMAMGKERFEETNRSLQKAQDIVMELINCLDMKYEISAELLQIYAFVHDEMIKINLSKDSKAVDSLIAVMEGLRNTWRQVQKESKAHRSAELIEN